MENEKLLTWMYEKIFPSRTHELLNYFSRRDEGGLRDRSDNRVIKKNNNEIDSNEI
jgi:hypothetical protein